MATSKIPYGGVKIVEVPFSGTTNGQGNLFGVTTKTIVGVSSTNTNLMIIPFQKYNVHCFNAYTQGAEANSNVSGTLYCIDKSATPRTVWQQAKFTGIWTRDG